MLPFWQIYLKRGCWLLKNPIARRSFHQKTGTLKASDRAIGRSTKLIARQIKPARLKSCKKSLIWNINRRRQDIGTFAADLGDKTCGI